MYIARKNADGTWLPPQNMGPSINSDKLDYCPFVDIARNNFYFTSERMTLNDTLRIRNITTLQRLANAPGNGLGDIYRVVSWYLIFFKVGSWVKVGCKGWKSVRV